MYEHIYWSPVHSKRTLGASIHFFTHALDIYQCADLSAVYLSDVLPGHICRTTTIISPTTRQQHADAYAQVLDALHTMLNYCSFLQHYKFYFLASETRIQLLDCWIEGVGWLDPYDLTMWEILVGGDFIRFKYRFRYLMLKTLKQLPPGQYLLKSKNDRAFYLSLDKSLLL